MVGLDEKAEGAFGSKGDLPHGLPSKGATTTLVRHGVIAKNTAPRLSTTVRSALWIAEC
jgi:hypothetical protein